MFRKTLPTLLLIAGTAPALASDYETAMRSYLETEISGWINSPVITDAIIAQNTTFDGITQARITDLDRAWRAEVGTGATPTIDPVLLGPVPDFLRAQVEGSGGVMTEVFVMDRNGLNVASSHITSDYWQGDEPKHQMTYGVGPDAVHFGEIEFDESSQRYQGQISVTITDPASGAPIGAVTVGVDAEALM